MDFYNNTKQKNTKNKRQAGETKPENEIKLFKEMRDNLLEIQKHMLSCKDFYQKFNSEVNQRQSIYRANKIIKEQFELIQPIIKELGALKALPAYQSTLLQKMLNEANNTIYSIHAMIKENNEFFTYVENIFETETVLTSTKFLFVQSIEKSSKLSKTMQ